MKTNEVQMAVLASLVEGRRHGYAIVQDVAAFTDKPKLALTTVYSCLEVLVERSLIENAGDEIVDGRARRYFALTDAGLQRLNEVVSKQAAQVAIVQSRLHQHGISWGGAPA